MSQKRLILVLCCVYWQTADENGSDGLDIDEFRAAFGQILGKGKNDQQVLYNNVVKRIIIIIIIIIKFFRWKLCL